MNDTKNTSRYAIAPSVERPLRRALGEGVFLRWAALLASVLLVGSVGATLAQPVLVSRVIDRAVLQQDMDTLRVSLILLLVTVIAEAVLTAGHLLLFAWVGERFLAHLRMRVFAHLSAQSLRFYDAQNTGELVSRSRDDVQALSAFVRSGLTSLLSGILMLILGVIVMGSLSLALLAASLVSIPISLGLSRRFLRRATPAQRKYRERSAVSLGKIEQCLSGAKLLLIMRRQQEWADSLQRLLDAQFVARMHVAGVNNRFFPWLEFGWVVAAAAIIAAGAALNSMDMVSIGVVSAFVLSLTRIFGPLDNLSYLLGQAQSAKASLGRIFALLNVQPEVSESPGARDLPARGSLVASNVTFAYVPGRPVLENINLNVQPGETLALVGATGAGKSTLARLLARLYDPDSGQVSYAGLDLRKARLAGIRRRIILLPQEGHLFRGAVTDNIRLSRPEASDTEVANVVRDLGLEERFQRFPAGLCTEVDERGSGLSAGERQLVSLARVALVNPEVSILDEALSNVDPGTEVLVQRAMRRLMEGRTVIVIAHREATAQRADRVACLDNGKLTALGRHDELLLTDAAYAALWGYARPVSEPRITLP